MSTKKSGGRRSSTSKKDLLSEKDEYEGEFNEKGKREGKGVCRFTTGETFEGQFKDGKMHGKGRLALADGDVFEGTWKSGHKQGSGTLWYASGRADVISYEKGIDTSDGARWSVDRQMAWRLREGEVIEEISLDQAKGLAEALGEPVPPQISATSPMLRATGGNLPTAEPIAAA